MFMANLLLYIRHPALAQVAVLTAGADSQGWTPSRVFGETRPAVATQKPFSHKSAAVEFVLWCVGLLCCSAPFVCS